MVAYKKLVLARGRQNSDRLYSVSAVIDLDNLARAPTIRRHNDHTEHAVQARALAEEIEGFPGAQGDVIHLFCRTKNVVDIANKRCRPLRNADSWARFFEAKRDANARGIKIRVTQCRPCNEWSPDVERTVRKTHKVMSRGI